MTISRRELFGMFRGARPGGEDVPAEPETSTPETPASGVAPVDATSPSSATDSVAVGGFSLDAFYATRTADRSMPPFAIRATVTVPTTRVGLGRTAAAHAPDPAPAGTTPIPPGLVPEVLPHRCLATTSFCSVCVERCPIAGALVVEVGRPRVDAARCDGCGHCVAVCPAPILAFALVPRRVPREPT